jgi:methylenetetrahydrofolate dehydrogenase (NADP+) / methenyltetrahydrofolate cyclohydrolase
MQLLDGRSLSRQILSDLKLKISNYKLKNNLHIILVGDDPASLKYVELKLEAAKSIGVFTEIHRFPKDIDEQSVFELINKLNDDPQVSGFFIQLPLPTHFDKDKLLNSITPQKDVDGLNPASGVTPAAPLGIVKLLENYQLLTAEKTAVIINDSKLIGIPLKKLLEKNNIRVTLCNEFTKNIANISRGADIVISATGQKGLITPEYIKPGAIVVDAASGDIDFSSVSPICSYITPTFGGVGPMTVACLLLNLVSQNVTLVTSYNKTI